MKNVNFILQADENSNSLHERKIDDRSWNEKESKRFKYFKLKTKQWKNVEKKFIFFSIYQFMIA